MAEGRPIRVPAARWRRPEPICPHCGHVNADGGWEAAQEGEGEQDMECPECERAYVVSVFIRFEFTTWEKPA